MTTNTLSIYGYDVPFDGVPLGIEVRAAEEVRQSGASEIEGMESLAVAIINARLFRHQPDQRITKADLEYRPFTGMDGVAAVMNSIMKALQPKKAEGGKAPASR